MEITKKQALTNLASLRYHVLDAPKGAFLVGLLDEIGDYIHSIEDISVEQKKRWGGLKTPSDRLNALREIITGEYGGFEPTAGSCKPEALRYVDQADPTGRGQHEPGAKLDEGKVRAALVGRDFGRALRLVAEVSTYGANKYTPQGWASVPDGQERYIDAAFRHLFALRGPESFTEAKDDESGLAHLAHAAWNLLAVLELSERAKEKRGD